MKLFLDSANIDEIIRIARTSAISGVTTNPSLISKEKPGNYVENLHEICGQLHRSIYKKHLSIEVLQTTPDAICHEAYRYANEFDEYNIDIYIKIPVTLDNLEVITTLEKGGLKINATAVMTDMQAKMAQDAGAHIVSFFYNRMKDGGIADPADEISSFANNRCYNEFTGRNRSLIICGSIRKPTDVKECWNAGADIVTVSMDILKVLISHSQTDLAIKKFEEDIKKWQNLKK